MCIILLGLYSVVNKAAANPSFKYLINQIIFWYIVIIYFFLNRFLSVFFFYDTSIDFFLLLLFLLTVSFIMRIFITTR